MPAWPPYEPKGNTPEEREVDRKRFMQRRLIIDVSAIVAWMLFLLLIGFLEHNNS